MNLSAQPGRSGVLTFLFTDIEGSTRRWEHDPGRMRMDLAAHDEALRRAVTAQGGEVFKHTGDGVCAVFPSPSAAVDAAVDAQRSLQMPVRMGIATGEAELRDGDYFGTVLNRASRIMGAGHGGQILLDGTTAGLVADVELMPLGQRTLRDLAKAVEVFQVRADGLPTEFPALRTLDATPGNLRPALTSFVGREQELIDVMAAVGAHRLVTLTGVGGVGKTRLATEAAAALAREYPDGVWLVEFAPLGDTSAVPEAVAAALGITQQAGKTLTLSVAEALEGRSRLLVFDNCEHVLDAVADLIETILDHSRTVRILATSREGLRVADEQLWPVPSLDVRSGIDSSAAELFIQRAAAVAPNASMATAAEASAIAEICHRLDGIPLAIELAASRMVSMTAAEVRERLDHRFQLLVGSRRGLERHQTLRHAVQWSYDLLDDSEQTVLQRCSVFAGGFDLPAAASVAGLGGELATLDVLDSLVRKSLIGADRSSGRTRYSMLETIRQFAEEKLAESGSAAQARSTHAAYFAGRESDVMTTWDGPAQRESHEWFLREFPNLRAAFRWAADNDDLAVAVPIAIYAAGLGALMEQFEPVAWAEELIEPARDAGHTRLTQLYTMASQCCMVGRLTEYEVYAEAAETAIDSGRYEPLRHYHRGNLPSGYLLLGRTQRGIDLCRKIIAHSPGRAEYVRACMAIGLLLAEAHAEAVEESKEFRSTAEFESRHGNPGLAAFMLYAYGFARRDSDPSAAYEALAKGLQVARDSYSLGLESALLVALSRVAALHREPAEAFDLLAQGIRHYHDAGSPLLTSGAFAILATLLQRLGHLEPAAVIGHFADNLYTRMTYPETVDAISALVDALGPEEYRRLSATADTMTNSEMVAYTLERIDEFR